MKHCNTLPDCIVILVLALTGSLPAFSQDRCGTVEYTGYQHREDDSAFEQWLTSKIHEKGLRTNASEIAFQIPVVVHVIHKGEAVGSGSNITEAQIMSQISVLNSDFNRQNADTVNTPSSFLPVAGRLKITFVMARQTPAGLPTNGILRVKGSKKSWSVDNDVALKAMSYWPAEDYLNLWVTDLAGSLMGYAQFPVSTLPGLEGASVNRLTDGVVVDYRAFGSIDDGNFNLFPNYNKGRAATHEVGHFLGLRHIWGDDDGACGGNGDYVSDTPAQADNTNGCPAHPYITCSTASMFQNYMDYTNDNCMNIFTAGQTGRMETVLNNSPRRNSLLNSHGLASPQPGGNIAIKKITRPSPVLCTNEIQPSLVIENEGSIPISSFLVRYTVNHGKEATASFAEGISLQQDEVKEITLPSVTLAEGENTISFEVAEPNGLVDIFTEGNNATIKVVVNEVADRIPLRENFDQDDWSTRWTAINPVGGNDAGWKRIATQYNESLYVNSYNPPEGFDEAWLVSPVLDFSGTSEASLFFDLSYRHTNDGHDGFEILASRNCGVSYDEVLFDASGVLLSGLTEEVSWMPTDVSHWQKEYVNLNALAGEEGVRIAFVFTNGNGNNFYLDNLEFFTSDDPAPLSVDAPYTLYGNSPSGAADFYITFNLAERQPVQYELVDVTGKLISREEWPDVLNQTFRVECHTASQGLYVMRLLIGGRYYANRVVVSQ